METFALWYAIAYIALIPVGVLHTWYQAGTGQLRDPVSPGGALLSTIFGAGSVVMLLHFLGVL